MNIKFSTLEVLVYIFIFHQEGNLSMKKKKKKIFFNSKKKRGGEIQ